MLMQDCAGSGNGAIELSLDDVADKLQSSDDFARRVLEFWVSKQVLVKRTESGEEVRQ